MDVPGLLRQHRKSGAFPFWAAAALLRGAPRAQTALVRSQMGIFALYNPKLNRPNVPKSARIASHWRAVDSEFVFGPSKIQIALKPDRIEVRRIGTAAILPQIVGL